MMEYVHVIISQTQFIAFMNASDVYALHHVNIFYQCILDQFIHIKLCVTVTWWLVSDIRWRARCSPPAGHDIAGPGLHMDLPIAQVRSTAVFRCGNVAPVRSPIEEQAAAGQWPGPGRLRCNEP